MSKTTKIIAALGVVAGLGVAALPMGAFADSTSASQDVVITVNIGESISIAIDSDGVEGSTDPNVTLDMEQNSINTEKSSSVKVSTNSESGYTLTVKDKDENTALVNQTAGKSSTIPASVNVKAGTAAWAIKGGLLTNYTAMVSSEATALIVNTKDSATNGLEETVVEYGFSTAPSQEQGAYKDTIVYTATKNV